MDQMSFTSESVIQNVAYFLSMWVCNGVFEQNCMQKRYLSRRHFARVKFNDVIIASVGVQMMQS